MKPVLLDTGPIVALLDSSDKYHRACVEAISQTRTPLVTCEPVIAESCYLLRRIPQAVEAVLENVASGVFVIPLPLSQIARDVVRIIRSYRDRNVDLADACLVHLANDLGTGDILTLDRDFEIYRWGRRNSFRLLVSLP